ncbi:MULTISPECIES: hypothetical protein [Chryseobacterium]|uniref:Uncharacterized protein n=1 Tax=Chryseobacterium gambrini TaxID=373672 RepID=A0A1N7LD97_9FLAO|nr:MULTISPECIES: hypothetical protein [Chryseobacterium]SIS71822.1 hypothetical protein SAMN05421785_102160 [Chryseobacterium gambrini]
MKKIFVIGALAMSALSFAKPNVESSIVKKETKEAKFRGVYTVTFTLPCTGQTITAWYYTTTTEGTAAFNADLAWAVNVTVDENCGAGTSGVNTGF